jgi:hypothetical protein
MQKLYHGTLARNVPSIRAQGLVPQKGSWTKAFYNDARDLLYAVDEGRKARLIAIITGHLARSGIVCLSDGYTFDDFKNDLSNHGAVVIFTTATFSCREPFSELKHPSSVEQGDWYSTEPVSSADIEQIMTGRAMQDWLNPHAADFDYRYRCILQERNLSATSPRQR